VTDLVRFGVAVDRDLVTEFDGHIARRGYATRSEALRDLMRADLVRDAWDRDGETIATISLVYDHHVTELTERLNELQHAHHDVVLCTTHVHLDADHCLEVVIARGPARVIKRLADRLTSAKGVIDGSVTGTSLMAGVLGLPGAPPHEHEHPYPDAPPRRAKKPRKRAAGIRQRARG
jgi:CopG family nickel-responsive transcriptional regulator